MLTANQSNIDKVLSEEKICGHLMMSSIKNFYIYIAIFIILVFVVLYVYYVICSNTKYVFLLMIAGALLSSYFRSDVFPLLKSVVNVECERYIYKKTLKWLKYCKPYSDNNIYLIVKNFTSGFVSLFFLVIPAAIGFVFQFIELKNTADYRVLLINLSCIVMLGVLFRIKRRLSIQSPQSPDILTSISRYAFMMERSDTIDKACEVCLEYFNSEKKIDLYNKVIKTFVHAGMCIIFMLSISVSYFIFKYPQNHSQMNSILVFYGALGVCVAEIISMVESFDNTEHGFQKLKNSIIIKKSTKQVNSIEQLRLCIPAYYSTIAKIDERYMSDLKGFRKEYNDNSDYQPLLRDIDLIINEDYVTVTLPDKRKYEISFYEKTNIVIKGRSGEGKSTCMKFMCGCIFNPYSFVDGIPTQSIDDKSLGKIFRYFPQDDMLIDDISICDNFKIRGIKYEDALRVAEGLNIGFIIKDSWQNIINKVPMSGGQRKRLNLAVCGGLGRFNFFDESFSALSEDEQEDMKETVLSDNNRGANITIEHMGTMAVEANLIIQIDDQTFTYLVYDDDGQLVVIDEPGAYRDCIVEQII